MVVNALRATGFGFQLREIPLPQDGVTLAAIGGVASSRGTRLNFAIVLRRPSVDPGARPYWFPIVPGAIDSTADRAWSNFELVSDSGSGNSSPTQRKRKLSALRKRDMSARIEEKLAEQAGRTARDLL
jgi:hypothetical protein